MPTSMAQNDQANMIYTRLMIFFGALCMSIIMFFLVANFVGPDPATLSENRLLVTILTAFGTALALISIFVRQKAVARATQAQRPEMLLSAHIIAFALCEAAALCGFVLRFTTNDRYYYFLFLVGIICLMLNRPRRSDVVNASSVRSI